MEINEVRGVSKSLLMSFHRKKPDVKHGADLPEGTVVRSATVAKQHWARVLLVVLSLHLQIKQSSVVSSRVNISFAIKGHTNYKSAVSAQL